MRRVAVAGNSTRAVALDGDQKSCWPRNCMISAQSDRGKICPTVGRFLNPLNDHFSPLRTPRGTAVFPFAGRTPDVPQSAIPLAS